MSSRSIEVGCALFLSGLMNLGVGVIVSSFMVRVIVQFLKK